MHHFFIPLGWAGPRTAGGDIHVTELGWAGLAIVIVIVIRDLSLSLFVIRYRFRFRYSLLVIIIRYRYRYSLSLSLPTQPRPDQEWPEAIFTAPAYDTSKNL